MLSVGSDRQVGISGRGSRLFSCPSRIKYHHANTNKCVLPSDCRITGHQWCFPGTSTDNGSPKSLVSGGLGPMPFSLSLVEKSLRPHDSVSHLWNHRVWANVYAAFQIPFFFLLCPCISPFFCFSANSKCPYIGASV